MDLESAINVYTNEGAEKLPKRTRPFLNRIYNLF